LQRLRKTRLVKIKKAEVGVKLLLKTSRKRKTARLT